MQMLNTTDTISEKKIIHNMKNHAIGVCFFQVLKKMNIIINKFNGTIIK